MSEGPLVAPLIWLGVGRVTSERDDRFAGGLVFCFFPAAPVFWLIAHFVGGGRILFAIWVLLLVWSVHISCQLDRRERFDMNAAANAKAMRTQRYVPIMSGIFDLAIVLGLLLFWSPEFGGFWWWVRGGLFALFAYMGIGSLKRGLFASDTEIARMVAGEYDAKD